MTQEKNELNTQTEEVADGLEYETSVTAVNDEDLQFIKTVVEE